jgi:GNAT superfamily N-acetyltransferase
LLLGCRLAVSRYRIRRAGIGDLPQLGAFFKHAYGERTILQNLAFLAWFLGADGPAARTAEHPLNAFIALDESGAIVAHYGYLPSLFSYRGSDYPLVWGVSAFTLPTHRQFGLGKALVDSVQQANDFFGVIGFSEETADFYDRSGFNVFRQQRFRRHVRVLDTRFREVLDSTHMGPDHLAKKLAPVEPGSDCRDVDLGCSSLTAWDDAVPGSLREVFTRRRTRDWLAWRFSPSSLLDYQVRAAALTHLGRGLIAYRSIPLPPTPYRITKIVDLYGDEEATSALLETLCQHAYHDGHLYVQFDSFGSQFASVMERCGFVTLSEEDSSLLPSLYNPVAFRPNREYVGLFSKSERDMVQQLQLQNVYLTQADSDRDRRASV